MTSVNTNTLNSTLLSNEESQIPQDSTKFPMVTTVFEGIKEAVTGLKQSSYILITENATSVSFAAMDTKNVQNNEYTDNFDVHADFPQHEKIKIKGRIKAVRKFKPNPSV